MHAQLHLLCLCMILLGCAAGTCAVPTKLHQPELACSQVGPGMCLVCPECHLSAYSDLPCRKQLGISLLLPQPLMLRADPSTPIQAQVLTWQPSQMLWSSHLNHSLAQQALLPILMALSPPQIFTSSYVNPSPPIINICSRNRGNKLLLLALPPAPVSACQGGIATKQAHHLPMLPPQSKGGRHPAKAPTPAPPLLSSPCLIVPTPYLTRPVGLNSSSNLTVATAA
jgi:hypothetical protein